MVKAGRPIPKKFDTMLVDEVWQRAFQESGAKFITHVISDHIPLIVTMGGGARAVSKLFKFFDFWTDVPGFQEMVQQAWR